MFIEIDETIVRLAEQGSDTGILVLRDLAEAYRKGLHIVFAKKEILERILNLADLDRFVKGEYEKIKALIAVRYGPLSKLLKDKAVVYSGNTTINATIKVDIMNKGSLDISTNTFLICENQIDCKVYVSMAMKYISDKQYKLNVSREDIPGNGASLGDVYRLKVNAGEHFVCAIADSDKYFPKDVYKVTAKGLQDAHDELTPRYASIYIMDEVREMENLIPLSLLPSTSNEGRSKRADLVGFNTSFFDMKEGLKHISMQGEKLKEYWKTQLAVKPDLVSAIENDYQQSRINHDAWARAVGDSKIINGFGKDIMEDTYSTYTNYFIGKKPVTLTQEQKTEWLNIGQFVFEWCCSPQKSST